MKVRFVTYNGVFSFDRCSRCQNTRVAKFELSPDDKRKKPIVKRLCDRCARHLNAAGTEADFEAMKRR